MNGVTAIAGFPPPLPVLSQNYLRYIAQTNFGSMTGFSDLCGAYTCIKIDFATEPELERLTIERAACARVKAELAPLLPGTPFADEMNHVADDLQSPLMERRSKLSGIFTAPRGLTRTSHYMHGVMRSYAGRTSPS